MSPRRGVELPAARSTGSPCSPYSLSLSAIPPSEAAWKRRRNGMDPVHIDAEMPPSRCFPVVKRTVDSGVGWRISMEK